MFDVARSTEHDQVVGQPICTKTLPPTCEHVEDDVRMRRGMSKALINRTVVSRAREMVLSDLYISSESENQPLHVAETPVFTFVLPNINIYPDGFKAFLYKELIESPTLVSLEQGGFLNWWADIEIGPRLYPLQTSGDGNCLLHAASLAMWGFHDRQLVLRKLLALNMAGGSATDAFRRRWRWQQTGSNKQCGLVFSEEEWDREWQYIVSLADWQPKNQSSNTATVSNNRSHAGKQMDSETVYESLEELHVFILAHVLRRPVIVIAKSVLTNIEGEALAPIPFGGIYLPLECAPSDCHRSPLLLTYDAAHFSALVWMDSEATELAVPLVGPQLELLPLHFATDPGSNYDWQRANECDDFDLQLDKKANLIKQYTDVKFMPATENAKQMQAFNRLMHQRRSSLDSAQINFVIGGQPEAERKQGSVGVPRQIHGAVMKTFGSLGRSVSKKLKNITHVSKTNKLSVGRATQSSRRSTLAVQMLSDHHQILCTVLSQRRMFHQDELVRNYLDQASQRYAELRVQHHRQSDELERLMSPKARTNEAQAPWATRTMQVPQHMPAFERKNTLLLTGKSKFYTMSYEDHCQTPEPTDEPPSVTRERCSTVAVDNLSTHRLSNKIEPAEVENCTNTDSENLQHCGETMHVEQSNSEGFRDWVSADTNHNSIVSPGETQYQGALHCPHLKSSSAGNTGCASCFQAQRFSTAVQYPTEATKL